jgi:hypothetical protein
MLARVATRLGGPYHGVEIAVSPGNPGDYSATSALAWLHSR